MDFSSQHCSILIQKTTEFYQKTTERKTVLSKRMNFDQKYTKNMKISFLNFLGKYGRIEKHVFFAKKYILGKY